MPREHPLRFRLRRVERKVDLLLAHFGLSLPDDEPEPPDPLVGAFLTHLPLEVGRGQEAPFIRQRVSDGIGNGAYVYGKTSEPMPNPARWQPYIDGAPFPLTFSPKNIGGAAEWCAQWPDEWRDHLLVQFWQEPQGDFHGHEGDFHGPVRELAAICADHGIRTGVHLETWHLSPSQPDGGTDGARALLEPVLDVIDACTWSLFEFNLKATCLDHVDRLASFMADYLELPWGATAIGVSVPSGIPDDDPRRTTRAGLVSDLLAALSVTDATIAGHYALPVGPDPSRDFYDPLVAEVLASF